MKMIKATKISDYKGNSRCRVAGLKASEIQAAKNGVSSDAVENQSIIQTTLGPLTVWWCYRESADNLGRSCVCARDDASILEINSLSIPGFEVVESRKMEFEL